MEKLAPKTQVLYHVGFAPKQLKGAKYALLPGDPGRVKALAEALGPAEEVLTMADAWCPVRRHALRTPEAPALILAGGGMAYAELAGATCGR